MTMVAGFKCSVRGDPLRTAWRRGEVARPSIWCDTIVAGRGEILPDSRYLGCRECPRRPEARVRWSTRKSSIGIFRSYRFPAPLDDQCLRFKCSGESQVGLVWGAIFNPVMRPVVIVLFDPTSNRLSRFLGCSARSGAKALILLDIPLRLV